jgi:Mrp family chromosome partitioning ATPase
MARSVSPGDHELEERMGRIGRKLLILSGKGGVGKSTVAVNVASALARAGRTVGLLDVDIHGPSIPTLLGLAGQRVDVQQGEILPIRLSENLRVLSMGLLLPRESDPVIWRGPLKHGAIRQFLRDVVWGDLDYLVVDSPPGTGDEPLTVARLVGDDATAIIVTTPQQVAIADVRRCISFCRKLSLPVLGLVENMSGFACPRCGERIDLFKTGGAKSLARETGVPLLGRIPLDPGVVHAGDDGTPVVDSDPGSFAAAAFQDLVDRIVETPVTAGHDR